MNYYCKILSFITKKAYDKLLSQSIEHAKAKQTKMYAISLGGKSAESSYLKLCDKYWEYSVQNAENLNKNIIEESNI